ncbi:Dam-replacing, partial [mine drainage metagenome]
DDWAAFSFAADAPRALRDWFPDVLACVRRVEGETFSLASMYRFETELRALHPRNDHLRPKIRQQLQLLVARGFVERVRPGVYRKTPRV